MERTSAMIERIVIEKKTGDEMFLGMNHSILDFWSWAHSDMISNAERGRFAEYIVSCALQSPSQYRIEWDAVDVVAANGIKVEVNCVGMVFGSEDRLEGVTAFLEKLGFEAETGNSLYQSILQSPANYLQYYVGYLNFKRLQESEQAKLQERFSLKEFHRTVLEAGPMPFALLEAQFQ